MLFALCSAAGAQPPKKIPRIGFLASTTASSELPRLDGFRRGLHELGYTEGQNITIEYRFGEGDPDRLPALAAELVRLGVDVIVYGWPNSNPSCEANDEYDPHSNDAG
jgi:putative ABC transport system substrate-binding protein